MKEIYILHEFYTPSHFKALYDNAYLNGYEIKDYIIMSKLNILKHAIKSLKKTKKITDFIYVYSKYIKKLSKLKRIENKILIVGIAPYNKILIRNKKILEKNKNIYFTSWNYWDNPQKCVHGNQKERALFMDIINNNMDGIACVSESTLNSIRGIVNNNNIKQVFHAIDTHKYMKKSFKKDNKNKRFIFIGVLQDRKGVDVLLKWLKKTDLNFEFSFAGDGVYREDIKKLSQEDDRIKYLGFISTDTIKQTLKNYDFLVLPSREEPYGIVLLEALAAGIPCIISSQAIGPNEIINSSTGIILDDIDQECMESTFEKCISMGKDEYMEMSKTCLEESVKYSTENVFREWKNILDKI